MCGIAGIINKSNISVQVDDIKLITDVIAHRGPDADGYYINNNIALGHRRLTILDLNENANQPLTYNDNYILVFNGEIYNYIEIKNELIKKNYSFKTQSDTEVIIAAYIEWGYDCLTKFNGMWSFALYDKVKNILFCSRDRFGVKPFYYAEIGEKWVFGSEIKQILKAGVKAKANMNILADYLILGMEEHLEECFFDGIKKLKASHYLVYDLNSNNIKIQRYYNIKENNYFQKVSEQEALNMFIALFSDSVNIRLQADVKVGTCLSGGLDSSYIAAVASKHYNNITAITAKSSQINNDETAYAKIVADDKKLDWHIVQPSKENFIDELNNIIKIQEEPFGSPSIFMQFYVLQAAKKMNCKVMLDGQGGDEILFGYERYYPAYLSKLSLFNKISAFFKAGNNSKLTKKQLLEYIIYFQNPKIRQRAISKRFDFLSADLINMSDFSIYNTIAEAYNNPFELQKLELTKTQLPHLLRYEDRNSMYNNVETRLPFLDYRIVELALSLPINYKLNDGWTKYILRKAIENELPKEISWRKNKYGFEAPENLWLADKNYFYSEIKKSAILSPYLKNDISNLNNRTLWRLFNISIWEKIYNVSKN